MDDQTFQEIMVWIIFLIIMLPVSLSAIYSLFKKKKKDRGFILLKKGDSILPGDEIEMSFRGKKFWMEYSSKFKIKGSIKISPVVTDSKVRRWII